MSFDLEQEKNNLKYVKTLKKIALVNKIVHFIFLFLIIFVALIFTDKLNNLDKLYVCIILSIIAIICLWVVTFPINVFMFAINKKHYENFQSFSSWISDYLKTFIVNLIVFSPFIALISFYFLIMIDKHFCIYFAGLVFIALLMQGIWFYLYLVRMALLYGYYYLKMGENFDYWIDLTAEQNIKVFPIMVIKSDIRVPWFNAYAIGNKSYGLIIISNFLLDKLNKEHFAAMLAHETAHLINKDATPLKLKDAELKADLWAAKAVNSTQVVKDLLIKFHELYKLPQKDPMPGSSKVPTLEERIENLNNNTYLSD